MSAKTSIEWTDATWNPIRGCSRVSAGCDNCYAIREGARFSGEGGAYHGIIAKRASGKTDWTGKVELIEKHLTDPLRWRTPRRVFVNSMSDLFHESLRPDHIGAVFGIMAAARHYTFQVLTKRPRMMAAWVAMVGARSSPSTFLHECVKAIMRYDDPRRPAINSVQWPLPNVWLGVSVEDQATADERIPLLLQTPAAVRFVSYEPALGPVSFRWPAWHNYLDAQGRGESINEFDGLRRLDWIIVGGESGPHARPFDVAWARQTIAQCKSAGVACFVKQLGAKPFCSDGADELIPAFANRKGGDWAEWPGDLRVREFPR